MTVTNVLNPDRSVLVQSLLRRHSGPFPLFGPSTKQTGLKPVTWTKLHGSTPPPLFLFGKTAHISLGLVSTTMMESSQQNSLKKYAMSPMAQSNSQFICKRWKEFYKYIHASSHSRCGINVKKFKENLKFFCCKKESLNIDLKIPNTTLSTLLQPSFR